MTKAEKDYIDKATSLGCIICGRPGEWHHARCFGSAGKKAPHCIGFCLCDQHHRNGGFGVAIHASQIDFEKNYGTEAELVQRTMLQVMSICACQNKRAKLFL